MSEHFSFAELPEYLAFATATAQANHAQAAQHLRGCLAIVEKRGTLQDRIYLWCALG